MNQAAINQELRAALTALRHNIDVSTINNSKRTTAKWTELVEQAEKALALKATETKTLNPGDLILDNHERICLVIQADKTPGKSWLADQSDPRMRALPAGEQFYEAFPLTGGAVSVPASLCTFLRRATEGDVAVALKGGNGFAQDKIRALFPELCTPTLDEERDAFVEQARKAVLDALDELAEQTTGASNDGPKDGELPALFQGIEPIARRMFDKSRGL